MEEYFEKVYIRSEADLPKNEGRYLCHMKDKDEILNLWSDDSDWRYADWYLRPVEAEQEKVTDEDIINYALEYISHKSLKPANKGLIKDALIIGAKAMRDGLITHNK